RSRAACRSSGGNSRTLAKISLARGFQVAMTAPHVWMEVPNHIQCVKPRPVAPKKFENSASRQPRCRRWYSQARATAQTRSATRPAMPSRLGGWVGGRPEKVRGLPRGGGRGVVPLQFAPRLVQSEQILILLIGNGQLVVPRDAPGVPAALLGSPAAGMFYED